MILEWQDWRQDFGTDRKPDGIGIIFQTKGTI